MINSYVRAFGLLMTICVSYSTALMAESSAEAPWNLPQALSDNNVHAHFEVDSTWHMVHGKVSDIKGKAELSDPTNPQSVQATIEFPVARFDTDNSSRDEELREVMEAEKFPNVIFNVLGIAGSCTPEKVTPTQTCNDTLKGKLTIRNVSKNMTIPVVISKSGESFEISGQYTLKWAKYGVEDPSIFIARLYPDLTAHFKVRLDPQPTAKATQE